MRIGVIGVGRIGMVHAATLKAHPEVERVTITDVDVDRAETGAAQLGVAWVASVDELLPEADAVVITAASSAHAELIHAAADAGLPTFCEKPISLDLESTLRVVEHVRS